jgi:hypothetical protein
MNPEIIFMVVGLVVFFPALERLLEQQHQQHREARQPRQQLEEQVLLLPDKGLRQLL